MDILNEKKLNYQIEPAANNEETLKIQNENGEYVYIHSKYEPSVMSERFINQYKVKLETIIIFWGVGLGYELINLAKKCTERNHIVVVETNANLLKEFFNRHKSEAFSNTIITFVGSIDELYTLLLTNFDSICFEKLTKFYNLAYITVFSKLHQSIVNAIDEVDRSKASEKNTILNFGDLWFRNTMGNIKCYLDSYDYNKIDNLFEGKPAIIVAGGPSLNKNVALLKKAKGKFVILAAYTAYAVLENNGIEPDLVFSIDAVQTPVPKHIKNGIKTTAVVSGTTNVWLNNSILKGKKLYMNTALDGFSKNISEKFGKEVKTEDIGGSVACSMFVTAKRMNCKTIIFVGQDLAFTNGKTHAEGIGRLHEAKIEDADQIFLVEGYYGGMIETSFQLEVYLQWFEHAIPKLPNDFTVINATEGGANIKGSKKMPLSEVLEKYNPENNVAEKFKEYFETSKNFQKDDQKRIYKILKDYIFDARKIKALATQAVQESLKLDNLYKYTDMPKQRSVIKLVEKLDKIDQEIMLYSDFLDSIFVLYEQVKYANMSPIDGDYTIDQVIVKRNLRGYKKLEEVAENAILPLKSAITKLFLSDDDNKIFYEMSLFRNVFRSAVAAAFGHSFEKMNNIFHNKPAIFIKGDLGDFHNLQNLKNAKGKCLIIAKYDCYNILMDNEIEPDFVLCDQVNFKSAMEIDITTSKSAFLLTGDVDSEISIKVTDKNHVMINTENNVVLQRVYKKIGRNVATRNIEDIESLIEFIGCKPYFFGNENCKNLLKNCDEIENVDLILKKYFESPCEFDEKDRYMFINVLNEVIKESQEIEFTDKSRMIEKIKEYEWTKLLPMHKDNIMEMFVYVPQNTIELVIDWINIEIEKKKNAEEVK